MTLLKRSGTEKITERMTRPGGIIFLLAWLIMVAGVPGQGSRPSISARSSAAEITLPDGRRFVVPKEKGQVAISEAQVAADGTAGWLVEYNADGVSYPISGMLVLWRAGKIVQRFQSEQVFYSWSFYDGGKQVAYHDGPLHGETASHCELHDVATGRVIDKWDGDLEGDTKPGWAAGLKH